jgi:hypothetical protein
MKPRRIILRGPHPTAESTAKLVGVSDRQVKQLLRLVRSNESLKEKKNGAALEGAASKVSRNKVSRTKGKSAAKRRIASASRNRRARGKTAEAHA